jgi:DNA-3-methyladenine glycosylase II
VVDEFTLPALGEFELARSIAFLEDWPAAQLPIGRAELRFAFCPEFDRQPTGVRVTAEPNAVRVAVTRAAGPELRAEVARILSLDVDATGLPAVVAADPVLAGLGDGVRGLRPVCFWSTWEAACYAVLSQRTSRLAAGRLKQRISEQHGIAVPIDGEVRTAFPDPATWLEIGEPVGVNPVKAARLRGLAEHALAGDLSATALRALPPEQALAELGALPGIGPFSAALILLRGAGAPDVAISSEPRLLGQIRARYGLPEDATEADYARVTDRWRPFRSWVAFWLRSGSAD